MKKLRNVVCQDNAVFGFDATSPRNNKSVSMMTLLQLFQLQRLTMTMKTVRSWNSSFHSSQTTMNRSCVSCWSLAFRPDTVQWNYDSFTSTCDRIELTGRGLTSHSRQQAIFWKHSSHPIFGLGTAETKPSTIKASNAGTK